MATRIGAATTTYREGREPSFTAMWHACLRNTHATTEASPVFADTRSVQLVPADTQLRVKSVMDDFSQETAAAIVLMSIVRHRVLAERLPHANDQGVRQLVILGAGLDTTGFALPNWSRDWRVFEVDHPLTQDWKQARIAELGWELPANLIYTPFDFETQTLLSALEAAGFDRTRPAVVSMFGVILYLTLDATRATLRELGCLAKGSEVTISYSPVPDGTDEVAAETFRKATPTVDATGESFLGFFSEADMERLAREAGFTDVLHHPLEALNGRYFDGRPDGLRLHPIEQLVTVLV